MIKNPSTIARSALLATLFAGWCGVLTAVTAQQSLFSVEGVVVDTETGQPLAGVRVSIAGELLTSPTRRGSAAAPSSLVSTPTFPVQTLNVSTNPDGLFVIPDVPAGSYRLLGEKDGYLPARVEGRKLPGNPGIPLTIGPGQPAAKVRVTLRRDGTIVGRVIDSAGRAVSGATANVLRYIYFPDGARRLNETKSGRTNDRGEYRVFGLTPGDYYVRIDDNSDERPADVPRYQPLFYPDTTEASRAAGVLVKSGTETRLNDIILNSPQDVILNSITFNLMGIPEGNAEELSIDVFDGEANVVTIDHVSGLSNPFSFQAPLRRGTYQVVSRVRFPDGQAFFGKGEAVPGDGALIANIQTVKGSRLGGRVSIEALDGSTRPLSGVFLSLFSGSAPRAYLRSAADGSFTFLGVPNAQSEVVFEGLPENAYVASALSAGLDVLAEGIRISGDAEIEVRVRTDSGTIAGALVDSKGEPVLDAIVALVPAAPNRSQSRLYQEARTSIAGLFSFRAIAPGSYHLFAWRELPGPAYRNSDFMKGFEGKGTAVRIEPGGRVTVNLSVLEIP